MGTRAERGERRACSRARIEGGRAARGQSRRRHLSCACDGDSCRRIAPARAPCAAEAALPLSGDSETDSDPLSATTASGVLQPPVSRSAASYRSGPTDDSSPRGSRPSGLYASRRRRPRQATFSHRTHGLAGAGGCGRQGQGQSDRRRHWVFFGVESEGGRAREELAREEGEASPRGEKVSPLPRSFSASSPVVLAEHVYQSHLI